MSNGHLQAAVHVARVSEVLDARVASSRQRPKLGACLGDLVEVVRLVQLHLLAQYHNHKPRET